MKVGDPSQGKEIPLVLSEDTLRPSCLPGHCYLFSENASSRHLLSVDASQTRCPCSCRSHGEVKWNRLLCTAGPGRNVCDPHQTEPSQHQELK